MSKLCEALKDMQQKASEEDMPSLDDAVAQYMQWSNSVRPINQDLAADALEYLVDTYPAEMYEKYPELFI